jgi:hypothetical protein
VRLDNRDIEAYEADWSHRYSELSEETRHLVRLFEYGHLPDGMVRSTSIECANLMMHMVLVLEDGFELRAGLRKLVESKDCFVRQAVYDGR